MRMVLLLVTCLGAVAAQAAPVTLDFEEFGVGSASILFSKGYTVTLGGGITPNADSGINTQSGSKSVFVTDFAGGLGGCGGCTGGFIRIERSDGGEFVVQSAVVGGFVDLGGSFTSPGYGPLHEATTLFQVSVSGAENFGFYADDIVVSAVPVPAALWLFGSALLGLGWLRSR